MTSNVLIGVVLPAVLFAAVYFPAVTKLSMALVSPYDKADVRKRLFAATLDGIPVVVSWSLYWDSGAPVLLVLGAGYLLLRDSVRGQSLGKLLCGVVVISLDTGQPCTLKGSVWRNLIYDHHGA
jgi:RDD family